ncbi:hypothetical protein HK097_005113 [Rhizophlyctis rosea]|uniref:RRM domain-containing protein n=1 Tax=Rhizophlyctis rosea TaxID=64517 RepID=A0AAD5X6Y3_9FUNG|nr:hypothetical protein HK097_005113 [Rhizophlyctis rosea]
MSHPPKTTIHVTNITKDKATLKKLFQSFDGFRRISFHQDYCFVCFDNLEYATHAIDEIHSQTDMLAAYAKHGVASTMTPTIAVQPNPILYVSLFSYMTEAELTKIFRSYEGFDSHALVRFKDVEYAKLALEDLNATTNLFANYSTKGAKNNNTRPPKRTGSQSGIAADDVESTSEQTKRTETSSISSTTQPKRTIHVTNIDKDKANLIRTFSQYEGFRRIAFYADYCFVCFDDMRTASKSIEEVLFKTKMKANFAKADFVPHPLPPSAVGTPNSIIRISDYPSSSTEKELTSIFQLYDGFVDVQFYHASCLVYYRDMASAKKALDGLNSLTNFTAIYSKKGVTARRSVGQTVLTRPPSTKPTATSTTSLPAPKPEVIPSSQSSVEVTQQVEDDSTSSTSRDTPSPPPPPLRETSSEEDLHKSAEATDDAYQSMFLQPDMVAAAAEHDDVKGVRNDDQSSSSTLDSDGAAPDADVEQQPTESQPQLQQPQPQFSSLFSDSNMFQHHLQQHIHSDAKSLTQPPAHARIPLGALSGPDPHQHDFPQQQQHQHTQPPSEAQSAAAATAEMQAQLVSAKTFIDELFGRLAVLERENETLRQPTLPHNAHSASQHPQQGPHLSMPLSAPSQQSHSPTLLHPPHQHRLTIPILDPSRHDETDWYSPLMSSHHHQIPQPHHNVYHRSTSPPSVPHDSLAPSGRMEEVIEMLQRENMRLREELEERRVAYDRLQEAHKQCGVLQGLLAMCE